MSQNYSDPQEASSVGVMRSVKAKADRKRSLSERIADTLTAAFGSMWFFILNVVWFAVWIAINVGLIPGVKPFDPFPFSFLTMVVSLEAIALAIIVLMSQNRAAKIADLREEVDLQVDMLTESEITKVLQLLLHIADQQGLDLSWDDELQNMVQPSDTEKIEEVMEKEMTGKKSS